MLDLAHVDIRALVALVVLTTWALQLLPHAAAHAIKFVVAWVGLGPAFNVLLQRRHVRAAIARYTVAHLDANPGQTAKYVRAFARLTQLLPARRDEIRDVVPVDLRPAVDAIVDQRVVDVRLDEAGTGFVRYAVDRPTDDDTDEAVGVPEVPPSTTCDDPYCVACGGEHSGELRGVMEQIQRGTDAHTPDVWYALWATYERLTHEHKAFLAARAAQKPGGAA